MYNSPVQVKKRHLRTRGQPCYPIPLLALLQCSRGVAFPPCGGETEQRQENRTGVRSRGGIAEDTRPTFSPGPVGQSIAVAIEILHAVALTLPLIHSFHHPHKHTFLPTRTLHSIGSHRIVSEAYRAATRHPARLAFLPPFLPSQPSTLGRTSTDPPLAPSSFLCSSTLASAVPVSSASRRSKERRLWAARVAVRLSGPPQSLGDHTLA